MRDTCDTDLCSVADTGAASDRGSSAICRLTHAVAGTRALVRPERSLLVPSRFELVFVSHFSVDVLLCIYLSLGVGFSARPPRSS